MDIADSQKLQKEVVKLKEQKKIIGLVPTMGALHHGHLTLVDFAFQYCDYVIVSIFVNPTQFNNAGDLKNYPKNHQSDYDLLMSNNPNTIVFSPSVEGIYGNQVQAEEFDFGSIVQYMEGQFRSGHFNGVGTILKHLFDIVKPHKAFFGEKDYQQLALVKKLVQITGQDVEVIGCPTSRTASGLAESSRNFRLTEKQLDEAALIHLSLQKAKAAFHAEKDIQEIKTIVKSLFDASQGLDLEYFEIAAADDLVPVTQIKSDNSYRGFMAAFSGDVRLIDNIAF
ncbi:MAG: pantoate--beta-alanine ligase [Flavobacteriaceae bacterium]